MGVGEQIFFVLAYRVFVAFVRRHRKFEFVPALLSLIVGDKLRVLAGAVRVYHSVHVDEGQMYLVTQLSLVG